MRKAQVSLEFVAASGLLLLFLVGIIIVVGGQRSMVQDKQEELQGRVDCLNLAAAITGVFNNPGSRVNVMLEGNATVHAMTRVIDTPSYTCTLPIDAVSDGDAGTFFVEKGNVTVEHVEGAVVVTNA
ncbi:MAG: hypothetical protein AABY13_03395 [Nanoarchaeota archaeon]